jgi:hypothetical protein
MLTLVLFSSPAAVAQDAEEIGRSVEGRPIRVSRLGSGEVDLVIVGGIHGGYEANSIRLARGVLRHFRDNPTELDPRFTLHVIENMNPDGLHRVTGGASLSEFDFRTADTVAGRFNANWVDLNRNWDADWQPTSYWGTREVDAGSRPFSEPETRAVRDYFDRIDPVASVFYQSAAAGLWYSGAEDRWAPSRRLASAYSEASGYRMPSPSGGLVEYEITGSSDDYFYRIGHRNLTVELTTHYDIEWDRNLRGLKALMGSL